jgi:hypothetical protein
MTASSRRKKIHCPTRFEVINPAFCSAARWADTVDCDSPARWSIRPAHTPISIGYSCIEKKASGVFSHVRMSRRTGLASALWIASMSIACSASCRFSGVLSVWFSGRFFNEVVPFNGISMAFQRCFNGFLTVFQPCFNAISTIFRLFPGSISSIDELHIGEHRILNRYSTIYLNIFL